MPNRFSTQAANADVMGQDAQDGAPEGMPHATGADDAPRDRSDPAPERETRRGVAKAQKAQAGELHGGEASPGEDINAAGFIKDKDAAKP